MLKEIPVEFTIKLKDQKVKEKEVATFTCELNKENAPVKWFRGGNEINVNDIKYKIVIDGLRYNLQILECDLNDTNDYTVSFRNKKSTAQLTVEGNFILSY
jgi:hypothetical protein